MLLGGGYKLNNNTRAAYFWRCRQLHCSKTELNHNLRQNLHILYDAVRSVIDNAPIDAPAKEIFHVKLNTIQVHEPDGDLDIPSLNVKSLQCVILFTEICKRQRPLKYFYGSHEYEQFVDKYDDFDHTLNVMQNIGHDRYLPLLEKSGNRFLVLLGEMSLIELVSTMADNIYLIGITTENAWADGVELNPFEFMIHDLDHAAEREFVMAFGKKGKKSDPLQFEREFIAGLQTNPDTDKILLILFLIIHEQLGSERALFSPKIKSGAYDSFVAEYGPDKESYYIAWKDPHSYGGLLPAAVRLGGKESIRAYLQESLDIFIGSWNQFFRSHPNGGNTRKLKGGGRRRRRTRRNP